MELDWLKSLLFSFSGRIGRQYWWLASLAVAVMGGMTSSLIEVAARTSGGGTIDPETQAFEPPAAFSLGLWLFVELGFLKGTQGPNCYGPDPLGHAQADARL